MNEYKSGEMPPSKKEYYEEAVRRGIIKDDITLYKLNTKDINLRDRLNNAKFIYKKILKTKNKNAIKEMKCVINNYEKILINTPVLYECINSPYNFAYLTRYPVVDIGSVDIETLVSSEWYNELSSHNKTVALSRYYTNYLMPLLDKRDQERLSEEEFIKFEIQN